MKRLYIYSFAMLASFSTFAQVDRSKMPEPGPAPEIKMGQAQSFVMPNGLKVYVVENHKLPVVNYSIDFKIKEDTQGDAVGYKDMVGELMQAGTKNRSKDQFNKELDMIGASINVGSDGIFAQSLKKHNPKLLELLSDMLFNPNFKQEELDKLKTQTLSGLETQKDDPESMVDNMYKRLIYGSAHKYGEVVTETSVNNIKLDQCVNYYNTYFKPNVAYMAIVGDINLAEAKKIVEKYFGKWQQGTVPVTMYNVPVSPTKNRVAIANKSGAVQSVVNICYPLDLKPGAEDLIAARVANEILGGGSIGRLFQNLREKHAWTYGSYSSITDDNLENSGSFSATANCKTESTDSSIAEILAEMKRLRTESVPTKDLESVKKSMAGKFALGLESPKTLARYAINIDKYNMPADFYTNYLKNLAKVGKLDIQDVANKYILPKKANILIAGDAKAIADKVIRFSADTTLEFYDEYGKPTDVPASLTAEVSSLSFETVVNDYFAAIGGKEKWQSLKDLTMNMSFSQGGQTIYIKDVKKAPNKSLQEVTVQGMVVQKKVFDGTKGFMEGMGQSKDMTAEQIAEELEDAYMIDELGFFSPDKTVTVYNPEKVNGKDAIPVQVKDKKGKVATYFYDVETKLKVKEESTEGDGDRKVAVVGTYADYRDIGGVKVPFSISQNAGGQKMNITVDSATINTGVTDDVFNK